MYKNRKKRTIIIGSLLAILIVMTVGYAAFSTQLNITGTSNIASNWDVQIIGITPGTPTGTGENAVAPSYTATTATMEANLYAPGDAMTYEITIKNNGNIDAVLDSITKSDSSNPAILFETSGVNEGDALLAGEQAVMTVKISYNSSVTSQPDNLTGELSLTLNYVQKPSGSVTPPEPMGPTTTVGGQEVEVVSSGDGLYADEYEAGKYTYKGANPNNYITFNNETWRIISISSDGTLKIMRNESIGDMAFDTTGGTYGNNNWDRPADLKTYLNDTYLPTITTNADKIVSHTWSIGAVTNNNSDLAGQITAENGTQSQSVSVGMITASEYLRANTNTEQCGSMSINNTNYSTCKTTNWIQSIVPSGSYLWTISPSASGSNSVFSVNGSSYAGRLGSFSANKSNGVSPVLYLSSDIALTGDGSQGNPYQIS